MELANVLKENGRNLPSIITVVKNVAAAYLITLLCLFIFAFVVTYTDFPQGFVPAVVLILTVFSVMLSGALTARRERTKGWLCGALSGLLYMLVLYCISSLAFRDASVGLNTAAMLAIGLFSGTFGGIIGINMKGVK